MIAQLTGILIERSPTRAVVDVGGVGYGVAISLATYERLPEAGATARLFTHTYVREDRLELFGFAEEEEREMFGLLIGVSGIGPNSALTILSGLSVPELRNAIFHRRAAELTKIRGVGPKTAERVVIDLKDKIRSPVEVGAPDETETGPPREAVMALVSLGIAATPARKAVESAMKRNGRDQSLQELIKAALQER